MAEPLETIALTTVEAELARRASKRLSFPAALEARYEVDTKAARAWNIRLTVPLGLIAYIAFGLTDSAILPDLGWIPTMFRLGAITPVGLFAMWMCAWASAGFREAFISYAITCTALFPIAFIAVSNAPLAPYTMLVVLLVSMFGNITMRLRFPWACFFTIATVLGVAVMLASRRDLQVGLAMHFCIAIVTGVIFGLVANYQLERAERRAYLQTLREMLRSDQLSADKAAYSALSLVDQLTGVANRRAFDVRLAALWQAKQAGASDFALLMIDVDHFKRFNDLHGHQAGDACLARVARTIRETIVRPQDLGARYGGEEFAVLIADCTLADAIDVAERIRTSVLEAAIAHGALEAVEAVITVSVGVAMSDGLEEASDVLRTADRNLYTAKRSGRDRVEPAMSRDLAFMSLSRSA